MKSFNFDVSRQCIVIIVTAMSLILTACSDTGDNMESQRADNIDRQIGGAETLTPDGRTVPEQLIFRTVEWIDLMPQDDLEALTNPPDYINNVEDGSEEDQISSQLRNTLAAAGDDRYQQALVSTNVIEQMSGQAIRIPGFIVPLAFDDEQIITQFFLVPFFGACIHVPPPPPNQIIFVDYPKGFKLEALYDPFWISGIVKTTLTENDIATSAYSIEVHNIEPYQEE